MSPGRYRSRFRSGVTSSTLAKLHQYLPSGGASAQVDLKRGKALVVSEYDPQGSGVKTAKEAGFYLRLAGNGPSVAAIEWR